MGGGSGSYYRPPSPPTQPLRSDRRAPHLRALPRSCTTERGVRTMEKRTLWSATSNQRGVGSGVASASSHAQRTLRRHASATGDSRKDEGPTTTRSSASTSGGSAARRGSDAAWALRLRAQSGWGRREGSRNGAGEGDGPLHVLYPRSLAFHVHAPARAVILQQLPPRHVRVESIAVGEVRHIRQHEALGWEGAMTGGGGARRIALAHPALCVGA